MKKRRLYQTISLFLLHSSLWDWAQLKWFCNPVLSCHSCALSWFACPIGVFIQHSGCRIFPFLAVGMVLVLGMLLARVLCGWMCPFGFLQDLLHKIPSPKFKVPGWMSYIKYLVLIFMVALLPYFFGGNTAFSFCKICPASALQVTLPNLIQSSFGVVTVGNLIKLGFTASILLLAVFGSRIFCKAFCPIGAMLAPLNLVSYWGMKIPTKNCVSCHMCDKACPTQITPSANVLEETSANRALDCVVCYECVDTCPVKKKEEKKKLASIKDASSSSGS